MLPKLEQLKIDCSRKGTNTGWKFIQKFSESGSQHTMESLEFIGAGFRMNDNMINTLRRFINIQTLDVYCWDVHYRLRLDSLQDFREWADRGVA